MASTLLELFAIIIFFRTIKVSLQSTMLTSTNSVCPEWKQFNDSHASGATSLDKTHVLLSECLEACLNDTSCYSVDYDPTNTNPNDYCWLFYRANATTTPAPRVTHYELINRHGLCTTTTTTTTTTTAMSTIWPTISSTTTTTTATTTSTSTTTTTLPPTQANDETSASSPATQVNTTDIPATTNTATTNTSSTVSLILSMTTTTPRNDSSANSGMSTQTRNIIIGVVAGVGGGLLLLLILLVVVLCICCRRRKAKPDKPAETPFIVNVQPEKRQPIAVSALAAYIANLETSSDGFKREFMRLPKENRSRCVLADKQGKKNRFRNILPYDDNRVKLPVHTDYANTGPDEDYFNASYIQIPDLPTCSYIATQGPMVTTIDDFWKVVWNEKINRIVMITLLTEQAKIKCAQYWPGSEATATQHGDVTVTLIRTDSFSDYTQRTLNIQHQDGGERCIVHFQFMLWRDKGVPTDLYPLLAFRQKVRSLDSTASGPLLVHCSAGVGRSGTFIALDVLLEQAKQLGHVDVYGVVEQLRLQRMLMVQVEDQYVFLYRALLDAIRTGKTSVNKSELEQMYGNIEQTQTASTVNKQFNLLNEYKESDGLPGKDAVGLNATNINKNRRHSAVPTDAVRVFLPQTGSDYINAAFVRGFKCPASYILTQLPLENTVDDFWLMIATQKCSTIVLLDSQRQEKTVSFLPTSVNAPMSLSKTEIVLVSTRQLGHTPDITCHVIHITNKKSSTPLTVHVYELSSWMKEQEVPTDTDSMLQLIHVVTARTQQQQQINDENAEQTQVNHVTVMCLDGVSRCGLFTAAAYMTDKMQHDVTVDVFLSCRYVLSARPQAITSLEQYKFLYRLAVRALTWSPRADTESMPVYGEINKIRASSNNYNQEPEGTYYNLKSPAENNSNLSPETDVPVQPVYENCRI